MAQIDGPLNRATLEPVNGSTFLVDPAEKITGRVVQDADDTANTKPYFYNGTDWKRIQLEDTSQVVSQNSGKNVTVDWSTGLIQNVLLTDNALISFSNPQEGKVHRLIITQNQTVASVGNGNVYSYQLNMIDQDCSRQSYQPQTPIAFKSSREYVWLYKAGVKPAIATIPSKKWDILTIAGLARQGMHISPDLKFLGMARQGSSPFQDFIEISDRTLTQQFPLGINNTPVAPLAAAGAANSMRYHPSGASSFVVSATSPFLEGYQCLDRHVPVTTKFSNPATLPAGFGASLTIHPSGNYVVCGHITTPFFSGYPFDGQAFGAKLANPATLQVGTVFAIDFSPFGDYLATLSSTTPYLMTYPFADAAGVGSYGTVVPNPSPLPSVASILNGARGIAWRPQGDYIAIVQGTTSPYIYIVPFDRVNGTYGIPISVASSTIGQGATALQFTPDGQYLVVGTTTAVGQSIYVYDFSAGTIGAPIAFDSGAPPTAAVTDIMIHPNGEYMFVTFSASPWASIYSLPQKVRNYVRLNNVTI